MRPSWKDSRAAWRWGSASFCPGNPRQAPPRQTAPPALASGLAYLNARKRNFAWEDREEREADHLAEKVCLALTGLYRRHCRESRGLSQGRLLSMYFLVPRPAQAAFREAARGLSAPGPAAVLLSGPWPPYNFVLAAPPLESPTSALEKQ